MLPWACKSPAKEPNLASIYINLKSPPLVSNGPNTCSFGWEDLVACTRSLGPRFSPRPSAHCTAPPLPPPMDHLHLIDFKL